MWSATLWLKLPGLNPFTRKSSFARCHSAPLGAMARVVLAALALALAAHAAFADRGNAALVLGGGAHMEVVKAHRAQEASETTDQLRRLQERADGPPGQPNVLPEVTTGTTTPPLLVPPGPPGN